MRRDQRSAEAASYRQWYWQKGWLRLRDLHKAQHPLCVMCERQGRVTAATVVDHIKPHKGDRDLFYDPENLQSLCERHHNASKQAEEHRGFSSEVGIDGWPLDARHPANGGKPNQKHGWSIPDGIQPSRIPVVLVCGPPAAGKSTYVQAHARKDDTVIDFDAIRRIVGGVKWDQDEGVNKRTFAYRRKMLKGLASKRWGTAWLIVMAPTKAERKAWDKALGGVREVIINPGKEVCLAQMAGDPDREATRDLQVEAIERWFDAFDGALQ
jgi:5-methylcytosine-specific restriction protein A